MSLRIHAMCYVDAVVQDYMRDVELDIADRQLHLHAPGLYLLDAKLPYPVDDASADAKFVKATRTLTVTVKVMPFTKYVRLMHPAVSC